jgi:hypothetical protein
MDRGRFLAGAVAVGSAGAPVAHAAPSTTTPSPAPTQGSSVYYRNCAEACADGVAPIRRGQPGYRPGLDRDGDGVACEVRH